MRGTVLLMLEDREEERAPQIVFKLGRTPQDRILNAFCASVRMTDTEKAALEENLGHYIERELNIARMKEAEKWNTAKDARLVELHKLIQVSERRMPSELRIFIDG